MSTAVVDNSSPWRELAPYEATILLEMARRLAQFVKEYLDTDQWTAAVANGVPAPTRASPTPNIPNGKATSPYVERSNPMGQGAAQTVSSKDPKAAALAASDMRNVVRRKLTGYVGFANLPNQWHRKSVRKGFNFNVMVVGQFSLQCRAMRSSLHLLLIAAVLQASRVLENPHLSIPSSIPLSTHHGNEKDLAWTSCQRPSQYNQSAQTSKKVAFAYD